MPAAHPFLRPFVDALLAAGVEVHVPVPRSPSFVPATFVYLTRPGLPGCVLLQVPTFHSLGFPPSLTVPVHPTRQWGSAVMVDSSPDPDVVVEIVMKTLRSNTVLTRFVEPTRRVQVVRRIPADAVTLRAPADLQRVS